MRLLSGLGGEDLVQDGSRDQRDCDGHNDAHCDSGDDANGELTAGLGELGLVQVLDLFREGGHNNFLSRGELLFIIALVFYASFLTPIGRLYP